MTIRRSILLIAVATAAALAANLPALAQSTTAPTSSVSASLDISWTAPTVDSAGATITTVEAPTSYQVYVSTSATMPSTPTATIAAATSTTQTVSATVGETLYVSVAACNIFGCGALSPASTVAVTGNTPGVPTNVTIAISLSPAS